MIPFMREWRRRQRYARFLDTLDVTLCREHGRGPVDEYGICYPVTSTNPTPGRPCWTLHPLGYHEWLYTIGLSEELGVRRR